MICKIQLLTRTFSVHFFVSMTTCCDTICDVSAANLFFKEFVVSETTYIFIRTWGLISKKFYLEPFYVLIFYAFQINNCRFIHISSITHVSQNCSKNRNKNTQFPFCISCPFWLPSFLSVSSIQLSLHFLQFYKKIIKMKIIGALNKRTETFR